MFSTYREIFTKRADSYHSAMTRFPDARRQEFQQAISYLNLSEGSLLCDVPAGGGYLSRFLPTDARCLFVETSGLFASHCPRDAKHWALQAKLEILPLADNSVTHLLCLAALHHIIEKVRTLSEFRRILTSGGVAVLADVEAGTGTASFLNEFVHRFNSMGHEGLFLDETFLANIDSCGLELIQVHRPTLKWCFSGRDEMTDFCKQLFGLDLAARADVEAGIEEYLGYTEEDSGIRMNWELNYVVVQKPPVQTKTD
jgi:SAM-dependent methyltransferase